MPFTLLILLCVVWFERSDGVTDRPLVYAIDVARACANRCVLRDACSDRDDDSASLPDAFCRGNPGVALIDFRMLDDDSDMGGDGGVAVTDASDPLAGGVVKIGDDIVDVPGDRSNMSGVCGVDDEGLR